MSTLTDTATLLDSMLTLTRTVATKNRQERDSLKHWLSRKDFISEHMEPKHYDNTLRKWNNRIAEGERLLNACHVVADHLLSEIQSTVTGSRVNDGPTMSNLGEGD